MERGRSRHWLSCECDSDAISCSQARTADRLMSGRHITAARPLSQTWWPQITANMCYLTPILCIRNLGVTLHGSSGSG